MSDDQSDDKKPVTIKKYANRRLYNTSTSSYVTLDHLATMVKEGTDFVVFDAKTGEDITRQVLTHIIVEEEGKGQNLLPISFLRHLISFYGDSLQSVVPNYLEHSMKAFARNQEQMRDYVQQTLGGINPFGQFEEVSKKNMAMFEEAMKMFSPFYAGGGEGNGSNGSTPPRTNGAGKPDAELDELRGQLEQMQKRLDRLTQDGKG